MINLNPKNRNKGLTRIAKRGGFTLVEMMVSISIFVLVAFTVTATLIAVSNGNRKAQELKQVMDNLNFSIQSMVLRMREGTSYTCYNKGNNDPTTPVEDGRACASGDAIVFYDPTTADFNGNRVAVRYFLSTDPTDPTKSIIKVENIGGNLQQLNITSPEVNIDPDGLKFVVGGIAEGVDTGNKPFVIIKVSGTAKLRSGGDTKFNLQTFVSQRN